ncbi:MAG: MFS transporter [Oscillospiraceae bacterium]
MNVQMVVYTEIIYAVAVTVCEIPSGILADKCGRKRLLAAYHALAAVELILLVFAHCFLQFAVAILLAGIGKAMSSGSENALLYDSLLETGRQGDFEKLRGRLSAIDFSGSVIAAISGSILASFFRFEMNYMVSIASMCIAFALTLSLQEPPMRTKPENERSGVTHYAKQALCVFGKNPLVLVYCLTGSVLGACILYLDEFWQIISEQIGIPVLFFGAIGSLASMLRIPGTLFAYKLKAKHPYKRILTCIIAISIVGYAAVFLFRSLFCLLPMMLLFTVAGIADPLVIGDLHHHTESHVRATVESFSSLGLRVISAGVGLLFGYLSTKYSIFAGFLLLSAVCLGYLGIFVIYLNKYRKKQDQPKPSPASPTPD